MVFGTIRRFMRGSRSCAITNDCCQATSRAHDNGLNEPSRRARNASPAAAAIGGIAEARSLILQGDVSRGLALLNEAAVAAVTGELDPLWTGLVYCEVVCAFQALGQYDLAEEWTKEMERWRHGKPVGSLHGRCRVHRAEILRLRGCCADAETEI